MLGFRLIGMTKEVQADTLLLTGQFGDNRILLAAYGTSCTERRLGYNAKNGRHRDKVELESLAHGVVDGGAIYFSVLVFHQSFKFIA